MKMLLYWALACGVLGVLEAPPLRAQPPVNGGAPGIDQPATTQEGPPSQIAPSVPGTSGNFVPSAATAPAYNPAQVPIVPGTAEALVVELRGGFAGVINSGPVADRWLGTAGIGTRASPVGGPDIVRGPANPYVAEFIGFGTQSYNTGFGPHSINTGFRNVPGY